MCGLLYALRDVTLYRDDLERRSIVQCPVTECPWSLLTAVVGLLVSGFEEPSYHVTRFPHSGSLAPSLSARSCCLHMLERVKSEAPKGRTRPLMVSVTVFESMPIIYEQHKYVCNDDESQKLCGAR